MDDENSSAEKGNSTGQIDKEGPGTISSGQQQANTPHSDRCCDYPKYKKQITDWLRGKLGGHRPLEWLTFIFEVLTFLALCVYSYFSYEQWQAMRDQKLVMQGQLDQMKTGSSQTDDIIHEAQIMSDSMEVNNEQNRQALRETLRQSKAALDASIEASRTDQRAWVGVTSPAISAEPELGKEFRITVSLMNTGKTPALNMSFKSSAGFFLSTDREPPKTAWDQITADAAVAVINDFPQMTLHDTSMAFPAFTAAALAAYRSHRTKMFARTRFDYWDIFRKPHFTETCSYHEFGSHLKEGWTVCVAAVEYKTSR